jgi:hypothetical protein
MSISVQSFKYQTKAEKLLGRLAHNKTHKHQTPNKTDMGYPFVLANIL